MMKVADLKHPEFKKFGLVTQFLKGQIPAANALETLKNLKEFFTPEIANADNAPLAYYDHVRVVKHGFDTQQIDAHNAVDLAFYDSLYHIGGASTHDEMPRKYFEKCREAAKIALAFANAAAAQPKNLPITADLIAESDCHEKSSANGSRHRWPAHVAVQELRDIARLSRFAMYALPDQTEYKQDHLVVKRSDGDGGVSVLIKPTGHLPILVDDSSFQYEDYDPQIIVVTPQIAALVQGL